MPRLLVLQHVPHEILGTLDPLLRRSGFRIRYVNFGRHPDAEPSLDGYDGMIVLGGPMNVDEVDCHPHLRTERRLIEDALRRELPVLGICLGAQLIATVLGARVGPSPVKEIGWYDVEPTEAGGADPLVRHFGPRERIFQWHGDAFEIPSGAVHLVRGDGCANQAFRWGSRVYGFQFHLEVDEAMVERWLRVPSMRAEIEALGGSVDPAVVAAETHAHARTLRTLSDRTFREFVGLFPPRARPLVLPSR